MGEYVMIPFKVKEDKVEETKKILGDIVAKVREKEPLTVMYNALQMKEDATSFIVFIIFQHEDAHMTHRKAPYVVDFIKQLYGVCPTQPRPIFLESLDACGSMMEALQ